MRSELQFIRGKTRVLCRENFSKLPRNFSVAHECFFRGSVLSLSLLSTHPLKNEKRVVGRWFVFSYHSFIIFQKYGLHSLLTKLDSFVLSDQTLAATDNLVAVDDACRDEIDTRLNPKRPIFVCHFVERCPRCADADIALHAFSRREKVSQCFPKWRH